MPHIRKAQAGSDSFGNVWERDGAVVEVPHEQAEQLLVIDDGQFTLADASEADAFDHKDDDPDPADPAGQTLTGDDVEPVAVPAEFSEVDPGAPAAEPDSAEPADDSDASKDAPKKTAARKSAARKSGE